MGNDGKGCSRCDCLIEKIQIGSPTSYYGHLAQVKQFISQGVLSLEEGTCPLEDLPKPKDVPWPSDIIVHVFSYTKSGERFKLWMDTYHGSGGYWEVSTTDNDSPS